ncbi:MAG TPA: ATP-binding protein [Syntrophorhabdaceae bacterium]|nr:ATP-binding protein [Syntrophorhabdaceae bacterium]
MGSEEIKARRSEVPIANGGICFLKDGKIVWVNEGICGLTGYAFEEFIGERHFFLLDQNECERAERVRIAGGSLETLCRIKDGSRLNVVLEYSPVVDSISVLSITGIRTRSRDEKEWFTIGKLDSLAVLARGIGHDFNNILTMILGNVSLSRIYMANDRNKSLEKLNNAEEAITRAKHVTERLMNSYKSNGLLKKVLLINDFLEAACRFAISGTATTCMFDVDQRLLPVEIDEDRISYTIGHLVLNGSQAMMGGGVLEIRADNVTIDAPMNNLSSGQYVRVSVKDNGPGIPGEYLGHVFDPGFSTKPGGTGIGLDVCASIAGEHGGCITVESISGNGATFSLYLPVFRPAGIAHDSESAGGSVRVSTPRVLFMDDERPILDMISDFLGAAGYKVDLAENGEQAISLYRKSRYNAVILDMTIPGGMGGRETIQKLLELDASVRAIASTGYSMDPVIRDFRQYGFQGVIEKPYGMEELSRLIDEVIAN